MSKKLLFVMVLAFTLVLAFASAALAFDPVDGFEEAMAKNLELYPNWIGVDAQGLPTTMPIFSMSAASNYIVERVWVEVPCDTDRDGLRDRVSLYIRRPRTDAGFKCPVVMEFSPYHNGTIAYNRVGNANNNSPFDLSTDPHVKDLQDTARFKPNYNVHLEVNPDTTDLTYDDIKYKGTEAWDPIWWSTNSAFSV
ncbi:MAG: hypothetical protein FWG06_03850, partial [Clostridiales bacterium]|nr:hypothetical protein [Clostridiales bacterium]